MNIREQQAVRCRRLRVSIYRAQQDSSTDCEARESERGYEDGSRHKSSDLSDG